MTTRRYRLRPTNTFAAVLVHNDDSKLLSRLGHDHVVVADEFTSTVAVDPGDPGELRFSLDFPVRQLIVDDPEHRRRVGFEDDISDKDRRTTRQNMLAEDQLDADECGTIGFRVDGARPGDQNDQWIMNARLKVRHEPCTFDFPVTVQFDPQLAVSGRVELTHQQLGMTPYSGPMGTIKNAQELTFVVDVEAAPL